MIKNIISQHAEEAMLLALQRPLSCSAPHFALEDLARFDQRLESHLDGLRVAGDAGWEICLEQLMMWEEPGEIFTAAILAWEARVSERIETVLKFVSDSEDGAWSLVSSLGWLTDEAADSQIDRLIVSQTLFDRRIGIAACAVRGRDPGEVLAEEVNSLDGLLKARALIAIGELARRDLLPAAKQSLGSQNPHVQLSAAWAVTRLTQDEEALDVLRKVIETPQRESQANQPQNGDQSQALQLALRRMHPKKAAEWLNELSQRSELVGQTVIGTGIVGLPESIPWLLQIMQAPALARVAGEAFTMIAGIDLSAEKFDAPWPPGFTAGPTEDPADDNVAMDPDENLPWPDAGQLTAWWQKHSSEFQPGVRYLCGQPLTEDWLEHVLRHGYQRQRAAAALELALLRPDQPLFNVRAPGHRQQELLGLL